MMFNRNKITSIIFILILTSCGTRSTNDSSMELSRGVSNIVNSADSIDKYVILASKRNDFSLLKPIGEETKSIRSEAQEIRQRIKRILEEKAKVEERLKDEKKLIWVDLIYRLAPVVLGVLILLIGRFLTQDPADTRFGIACFLSGIAINAFYDTIGNWGIIAMIAVGIGWFFYSHEKKDIAKKVKATTLDNLK